jgi:hypothetical protein
MTHLEKTAVYAIAAVQFLESCKHCTWQVNREITDAVLDASFLCHIQARLKVIAGRIPRNVGDAEEIAEWFFGPAGIFFENLMIKE